MANKPASVSVKGSRPLDRIVGQPGSSADSLLVTIVFDGALECSMTLVDFDLTDETLADAMSTDGTREALAKIAAGDERVRVVDNPTRTTPAGLNAAIVASRGDVIVRCDAHAELPAGYVARAVDVLDEVGADATEDIYYDRRVQLDFSGGDSASGQGGNTSRSFGLPDGSTVEFEFDPFRKHCLLKGLQEPAHGLRVIVEERTRK